MIIKSVTVENFRCIKEETLYCDRLTAMVGPNGSGKSTFLKALEIFYRPTAKLVREDFYGGNADGPITITVTFSELTPSERNEMQPHIDGDELVVKKEIQLDSKQTSKYFGHSRKNPDFESFRNMDEKDKEGKRAEYSRLRTGSYPNLPELRVNASVGTMEEKLKEWEQKNPDKLSPLWDDGGFFGFGDVGKAHLERYTRFLYIPSNYDASVESMDGRGTVVHELMNLVVRNQLAKNEEFKEFEEDVRQRYRTLLDPTKVPELESLEGDLTSTISSFAPGTCLRLMWADVGPISFPVPTAKVQVIEEGYETELDRAGDGVRRAFILTALQHLEAAKVQMSEGKCDDTELPSLILGIEEPELYQHPTRERHIAKMLLGLANGSISGVAGHTQVIYTTHSPLMIDLTRFDQIRIIKKVGNGNDPRMSKVHSSSMKQVTREMERINDATEGSYNTESQRARLHTLMTPWTNEGFFADVIVLVEGEGDRAAILGSARAKGIEIDGLGISVIPCGGKNEVLKATVIFRSFGLQVYSIWDCDEDNTSKNPKVNGQMFSLHGLTYDGCKDYVGDEFACFMKCLDTKLKEALPDYDELLRELRSEFGYMDNEAARKSPIVIREMLKRSSNQGNCQMLDDMVGRIVSMASQNGKRSLAEPSSL